jgi:hypothetical protein
MKPASDTADELIRLTDEEILALVETRSQRFQRQIRFRDWRELIAGGIAAVMIAPAVLRGPLLARAGALTILAGIGLVAFRLFAARRLTASGDVDPALPVANALHVELDRVDAQISLLSGVAWWYVAPLLGGSVLLAAGSRGLAGWSYTLGYTIFAALLGWGIIALNHRAVRRTLQPKRKEIMALLAQIES